MKMIEDKVFVDSLSYILKYRLENSRVEATLLLCLLIRKVKFLTSNFYILQLHFIQ